MNLNLHFKVLEIVGFRLDLLIECGEKDGKSSRDGWKEGKRKGVRGGYTLSTLLPL